MKRTADEYRELLALQRAQQEEERIRLAATMHDDISQRLTVLTMELALMHARLGENNPERGKAAELVNLITDLSQTIRKLTSEIRPKTLDEFGLLAALETECRRLSTVTGTIVTIEGVATDVTLSPRANTEMFRLFQEVMGELIRRQGIQKIHVSIEQDEADLTLRIRSSTGVAGLMPEVDRKRLNCASERALWIGGEFSFIDEPTGEAKVEIAIPLERARPTS